ncbi:hypothetical protein [Sulfitobacter donghicola]|uniref:Uncharacterized protein n=1 Tax=Sulfitobacter donghicola DSW-25 = KCTC 12864 = JCM 14565 TaxID=1300350 RepID=A0A073IL44_9RHOB|nr:hypothetical protein [Sulfitobacter donghicola]KEJ90315.1 hypothetical protein DSW25_06980 [Sulfitobacter donghicola DSW-25 = KCTC 12864 = JCM 14565]KIN66923.1 hypothetical protein Z948_627 [Sulfitobacter donghicola DSW-25 = KCTC 12864 = JCM 14565]
MLRNWWGSAPRQFFIPIGVNGKVLKGKVFGPLGHGKTLGSVVAGSAAG